MMACMGGWCLKREQCGHYTAGGNAVERLCKPGEEGARKPIYFLKDDRMYRVDWVASALTLMMQSGGLTAEQLSKILGRPRDAKASTVMRQLHLSRRVERSWVCGSWLYYVPPEPQEPLRKVRRSSKELGENVGRHASVFSYAQGVEF